MNGSNRRTGRVNITESQQGQRMLFGPQSVRTNSHLLVHFSPGSLMWTPPAKETKRYQQTPGVEEFRDTTEVFTQSRTAQHTHVGHESSLPDSPGTILFPTMPNQTDS